MLAMIMAFCDKGRKDSVKSSSEDDKKKDEIFMSQGLV